jgi:drug/metabolite transporter (DMT)-like permease
MRPSDLLQIVAMAALWGGSFLFLRVATPEFGPVPLIAVRVAVAGGCLVPFLIARGEWQEFRRNAGKLLALGFINAALPFPLFAYCTLYVTAGFASIINSTAPLFAALVAWLWLKDRVTPAGVLGLLIGFGGVVLLVGGLPDIGAPGAGLAVAGALVGSLSYGISASFVKRYLAGVSSWVTTTGSFGISAILLAPVAFAQWPAILPSGRAWGAVFLLAVACTSLPNIYYFRLVVRAGPAQAMAVAFLIPVFGMLWGALFLGEIVTAHMLLGCAVILLGTALVTGMIGRRAALFGKAS